MAPDTSPFEQDDCCATVTLVHGTFARDASWTMSSSAMASAIQAAIGESALLTRFQWSGDNTHVARIAAGDDLADHLEALHLAHPQVPHFVVAHSHGGNVALYALRRPLVRNSLSALACLGTPFISVKRRDLDPTLKLLKTIVGTLFWYGMTLLTAWLALFWRDLGGEPWLWVATGLAIAMPWIYRRCLGTLIRRVTTKLETVQERMLSQLSPAHAGRLPLLVVKVRMDEAALGLCAADLLANLPFRLWTPQALLVVAWTVLGLTMPLFLAVGMLLVSPSVAERMHSTLDDTVFALTIGTGSIGLMMLALGLATALAQILLPLWSALLRNHRLTFGDRTPAENWLLHINASPDPPSAANVTSSTFSVRGDGLRHSQLYIDSHCIDAIAAWIKDRVTRRPQVDEGTNEGNAGTSSGALPVPRRLVSSNGRRTGSVLRALGIALLCVPVIATGIPTVYALCPACPLPSLVRYTNYVFSLLGLIPDSDVGFLSWPYFVWIGLEVIPGLTLLWWSSRIDSRHVVAKS